MMGERWKGVVNAFCGPSNTRSKVMASVCCARDSSGGSVLVPSSNAIFLVGDRVENSGNDVIERLSQADNIASVLVSKLGATVNAWVVEPSHYCSNLACYQNLIPSLTASGEPMGYNPRGLPASAGLVSLLTDCLAQVRAELRKEGGGGGGPDDQTQQQQQQQQQGPPAAAASPDLLSAAGQLTKPPPRTLLFGFSKGGVVLNQLLAELASTLHNNNNNEQEAAASRAVVLPTSATELLRSIEEIHYVDVGLNCRGAYQTDPQVLEAVAKAAAARPGHQAPLKVVMHGTPRQWSDPRRRWVGAEKDRCVAVLTEAAAKFGQGKMRVAERKYYFGAAWEQQPSLQMHFQVIQDMVLLGGD